MKTIISPLLTEKSAMKMDSGLYVLKLGSHSTKQMIRDELKQSFDVDAISIRIVNLPAKQVNFKRIKGVRSAIKKAYVQLKKGQKLPGFELPKQKEDTKEKTPSTDQNEVKNA